MLTRGLMAATAHDKDRVIQMQASGAGRQLHGHKMGPANICSGSGS